MTSGERKRLRLDIEVVAMGASMGGLVAFQSILEALPEGFAPAVLIVQHRMAEVESRLVALLQRHCRLPLVEPDDKEPILGAHAYLAPAGYHMLVDGRSIALSTDPPVWFARPSIDVLFESIADAYGSQALGVLLTGANQDGASGAESIQSAGGRVLVQDPETALSPEAPRAALERFKPDAVLPLEDLAPTILRWCRANTARTAVPRRA